MARIKLWKTNLKNMKKELLIELLVECIEKIDNKTISYGSQEDNEEYKRGYENILEKVKSL